MFNNIHLKIITFCYFAFVHKAALKCTFPFNMPLCENSAGYSLSRGSKFQFGVQQQQQLLLFDLSVPGSITFREKAHSKFNFCFFENLLRILLSYSISIIGTRFEIVQLVLP